MSPKERSLFKRILYSKRSRLSVVLLLFAIVPTLFSSTLLLVLRQYEVHLSKSDLVTYIAFFGIAIFTISFALTPTTLFAIFSGYFFQWKGLPGVIISYMGAAVIGMLFGKKLNEWVVGGFISEDEKLHDFFERLKKRTFLMVVMGRLSPVLPFAMMNIAFASMQVPWGWYLLGSFLGMLPRTFLSFYLGMNVKEIYTFVMHPTQDQGMQIGTIALILISTAGIIWLIRKALEKEAGRKV